MLHKQLCVGALSCREQGSWYCGVASTHCMWVLGRRGLDKAGYLTVLVPHVTAGVIFGDTRALISYRRKEKQGPIVAGGRLGSVPLWTTQLVCFSPLAQEEQEVMGRPSLSRDDEEGEGRVLTRQGPDLDFCIEDRLGGWGGALNTEKL